MGTGSFPGVKYGWGVLLTTHPLLLPWSWKSRAIPPPNLWATTGPVMGSLCLFVCFNHVKMSFWCLDTAFLFLLNIIYDMEYLIMAKSMKCSACDIAFYGTHTHPAGLPSDHSCIQQPWICEVCVLPSLLQAQLQLKADSLTSWCRNYFFNFSTLCI